MGGYYTNNVLIFDNTFPLAFELSKYQNMFFHVQLNDVDCKYKDICNNKDVISSFFVRSVQYAHTVSRRENTISVTTVPQYTEDATSVNSSSSSTSTHPIETSTTDPIPESSFTSNIEIDTTSINPRGFKINDTWVKDKKLVADFIIRRVNLNSNDNTCYQDYTTIRTNFDIYLKDKEFADMISKMKYNSVGTRILLTY
jgi:hypothetical protein